MTVNNYAKALYELGIPAEELLDAAQIVKENPELTSVMQNPAVTLSEKHKVIDEVFPKNTVNFLKYLCDRGRSGELEAIIKAYSDYSDKHDGIIRGKLVCVSAPDKEQLGKLEKFLCRRFNGKRAEITVSFDESLIGGFVLSACGMEFDRSFKGGLQGLKQSMMKRI